MSSHREAEVLATFGRGLLLRLDDGTLQSARPFGRRLVIVCGDRVACDTDSHGEWLVREVRPRRSSLWRSNARGDSELLAANLDLLCVVIAPAPAPDLFMVDRYLCAARSAGLDALLILNKCDLPLDPADEAGLAQFAALGLTAVRVAHVKAPASKRWNGGWPATPRRSLGSPASANRR